MLSKITQKVTRNWKGVSSVRVQRPVPGLRHIRSHLTAAPPVRAAISRARIRGGGHFPGGFDLLLDAQEEPDLATGDEKGEAVAVFDQATEVRDWMGRPISDAARCGGGCAASASERGARSRSGAGASAEGRRFRYARGRNKRWRDSRC